MTLRYGIIGWPVQHSVSPRMQSAAFRALGIDASYELLPTEPNHLAAEIRRLRHERYSGWNVTVPHKRAMVSLVDELDPHAERAGSVNTVVNQDGRLRGYSTDGYGLAKSMEESFGLQPMGESFLFWGAGGAAAAAACYLVEQGAVHVVVVNRTESTARELSMALRAVNPKLRTTVVSPMDRRELPRLFRTVDVVIQSTSIGLSPADPVAIPLDLLSPGIRLVDMIARPTKLIAEARIIGCMVADGRGMLLHQGAQSFRLWTGRDAPLDVMRNALG